MIIKSPNLCFKKTYSLFKNKKKRKIVKENRESFGPLKNIPFVFNMESWKFNWLIQKTCMCLLKLPLYYGSGEVQCFFVQFFNVHSQKWQWSTWRFGYSLNMKVNFFENILLYFRVHTWNHVLKYGKFS